MRILRDLQAEGELALFNSTRLLGDRRVSPQELKLKTGITGDITGKLSMRKGKDVDRLAAGLGGVVCVAMLSGVAATEFLPGPPALRFLVVFLLAFSPYAYLLLGLNLPGTLAWGLAQLQRSLFPGYRRRLLVHEAGHFLCGYLLGLPVERYSVNSAVTAVSFWPLAELGGRAAVLRVLGVRDPTSYKNGGGADGSGAARRGGNGGGSWAERAAFEQAATLDPSGPEADALAAGGLEAAGLNPRAAWPYRGIDHGTLDVLAVVSMAGAVAEVWFGSHTRGGGR